MKIENEDFPKPVAMPVRALDSPAPKVAIPTRPSPSPLLGYILAFALTLLLASCAPPPTDAYLKGNTMGTTYTIHYSGPSAPQPAPIQSEIDALLDRFENQLSNWRPDSWINRFNAAPPNEPYPVPDYAFAVLQLSLELAERSDGALDPTVSPLIELWGFGTRRDKSIPEPAAIQAALQAIGYRKLVLDPQTRALRKTQASLQLNLSSLAKGYAVDLVARHLDQHGIPNYLVNIGGELIAKGTASDALPWQVAIARPSPDGRDTHASKTLPLSNRAMATSGHTQRAFVIDGQRYSHILDPKTGYPVKPAIASATILAPTCALADALATLALILDENQMARLLQSYPHAEIIRTPWPD